MELSVGDNIALVDETRVPKEHRHYTKKLEYELCRNDGEDEAKCNDVIKMASLGEILVQTHTEPIVIDSDSEPEENVVVKKEEKADQKKTLQKSEKKFVRFSDEIEKGQPEKKMKVEQQREYRDKTQKEVADSGKKGDQNKREKKVENEIVETKKPKIEKKEERQPLKDIKMPKRVVSPDDFEEGESSGIPPPPIPPKTDPVSKVRVFLNIYRLFSNFLLFTNISEMDSVLSSIRKTNKYI